MQNKNRPKLIFVQLDNWDDDGKAPTQLSAMLPHSLLRSRRPCLSRCSPRRGSIASPSRTLREPRDTRDLIPTASLGSVANESNVVGAKDK